MLIRTQLRKYYFPSDPFVSSSLGIPSDFVGWLDPTRSDGIRYRIDTPGMFILKKQYMIQIIYVHENKERKIIK